MFLYQKKEKEKMKHPKKPTVRQSKFIKECGFDPHEWMVVKDTSTEMWITQRSGGKLVITLYK
jgi:hypothetical protein